MNQVTREEESEANKVTVYRFSSKRNRSDNLNNLITKFAKLTTNNIRTNIINEVVNLTINDVRNNTINKVANLIINYVRNVSNRATMRDVQVQFLGDPDGISYHSLLSGYMFGIRQEKVPVLVHPAEPSIVTNNEPAMTVSTSMVQKPQVLKKPMMQ